MSPSTSELNAVQRAEAAIKSGASRYMPNAQLFLFGSRARGDARVRSDFDLAFKPKPGYTDAQYLAFEDYLEHSSELIYPVDLVDLRTAPQVLLDRIEVEGIVWKS